MTTAIQATTPQDALKQIRKLRLAHKNEWLFIEIRLEDKTFLTKTFNLSIQQLQCGGIAHSDGWDLTAKQFEEKFLAAFTY